MGRPKISWLEWKKRILIMNTNSKFSASTITIVFIIVSIILCMNKLNFDCDDKAKTTHIPLKEKFLYCAVNETMF